MLKQIFDAALPGIEALFAAVGLLILAEVRKWIATHTKNDELDGVLNRLTDTVSTVVAETEQTIVDELKKDKESLSKEDAERALAAALGSLKQHLGQKGLDEIEKVLRPGDLNAMLISKIEAEVQTIRQAS